MARNEIPLRTIGEMTEIIELQSHIINESFRIIAQHLTAEELSELELIDDIHRAAELCKQFK